MAVAQAQHAVKDMADLLEQRGVEVEYAIHPVAGRMPGHMNVLLAEADVPYDAAARDGRDQRRVPATDVALVIGANDVTNPAARDRPDSPHLRACRSWTSTSRSVMVLKRSMNTRVRRHRQPALRRAAHRAAFGDAKTSVMEVTEELKAL